MLNKGFNMIRMDFYWENIEKLEGLLAERMQRDIKPYWVLDYGNQICDDGEFPHSAEAISAFVDFSLVAVGHFQGKGVIWEVICVKLIFFFLLQLWNEPNLKKISINRTNYAILADAVGEALKDKYPDELFIGPGLAVPPYSLQ
jgi:polysaccharide biosynthesis protein PslG